MRTLFCAVVAGLLLCGVFAPSVADASPGMKWAICIGVSDYEDPDLADLPFARNDARDLGRALKSRGGFDRVMVLTDDRNPKDSEYPSRKNLLAAFERARSGLEREDTLLIFFSGHGVTDPAGRGFLLPADARIRNLPRTAVPLETVQALLSESRAEQRVLFLDGARKEIWSKGPRLQPVYPDRYLRDLSAVFYAAKKETFSHDYNQAPYGVFGGTLIAGVQGEADREIAGNKDGVVSLMELGAYVAEKVTTWSMRTGNRQSVYIRMFESGSASLAMSRVDDAAEERVLAAVEPKPPAPSREEPAAPRIPKQVRAPAEKIEEPPKRVPAKTAEIETPEPKKRPQPADEPPVGTAAGEAESEDDVIIGVQAPSIDEVDAPEPVEAPVQAAAEQPAPTSPAPEPEPARVEAEEEKALEMEAGDRGREARVVAAEEAPKAASGPSEPPEEVEQEPAAPSLETVSLRSRPVDLSEEGVRSLLLKNDFYATCWTYNGDFCNPTGEFANNYREKDEGTVTDSRTRLMWQKAGAPGVMDWAEAAEYIKELNEERFAGYDDWRLPTVEELASLMERSWLNDDLFLAPVFSSALKHCWSADTKGVERAWKGNFHLGFFLDFPMEDLSGVRAVRSIQ